MADRAEAPEPISPPGDTPESGPPPWLHETITRSIWTAVGIVLLTLAGIWFANQARSLIRYLVISLFLALALEPAVNWFHESVDGDAEARRGCSWPACSSCSSSSARWSFRCSCPGSTASPIRSPPTCGS